MVGQVRVALSRLGTTISEQSSDDEKAVAVVGAHRRKAVSQIMDTDIFERSRHTNPPPYRIQIRHMGTCAASG